MSKFVYLATPYSGYPGGTEAAYQEACKQCALFVEAKVPVFCPITHTHGPGKSGVVENTHDTWLPADRPFMDLASALVVCMMDGWSESFGVQEEIKVFQAAGKPVIYMSPGCVPRVHLRAHGLPDEPIANAWDVCGPQPSLGPDLDADGNLVVSYDETKPCLCDIDFTEDHCARCGRGVGNGCVRAERGKPECLSDDSAQRKATPICTGVLDYFPDALAAVARVSRIGNDKHNPGEPLHWSRGKSADHADCILRHMADRGKLDDDGELHDAKVAWRALAQLQLAEEKRRG